MARCVSRPPVASKRGFGSHSIVDCEGTAANEWRSANLAEDLITHKSTLMCAGIGAASFLQCQALLPRSIMGDSQAVFAQTLNIHPPPI